MIPINESWQSILQRIGERPPRHKRARCPIHNGDSLLSLALDEDKGLFYCHVCHEGGDKLTFIQQFYKCNFVDALRFFGLEPGIPPAPDPEVIRRQRARAGLHAWARQTGRKLRDKYYLQELWISWGTKLLRRNPDDAFGWALLADGYRNHSQLELVLDVLIGKEEAVILEYYRFIHSQKERRAA
jgi:hypothetical protein